MTPWVVQIGIALALCAGAFVAGVKVESNHRDAQLLAAERAAAESYRAAVAHQRDQAAEIANQLSAERRSRESDSASFREQLAKARRNGVALATCPGSETKERVVLVSTPSEPQPDLRSVDEPRFTAEFVRLHDYAINPSAVPSRDPSRVDGGPPAAGTVGAEDVLEVHQGNASIALECRSKLSKWRDLARRNGWAK